MSLQGLVDDIEFDSDGYEIFKPVELATPATVEIFNSDTERASSSPPSPVLTVSVVEATSVTIVDAWPSGIIRDELPRAVVLHKGDLLSVRRAPVDHNETPGAGKMPGALDRRRNTVRISLSEESAVSGIESNAELDGSSSAVGARSNRFARLRDNRFLRVSHRPQKEAIRSPPKKPRLGANLSHNVGSRREEVQTQSKIEMLLPDKENQEPVEGPDVLST